MAVGSSHEGVHGYARAVRGKSRAEKQKDWNAPQEERQDEKRRTEAGRESCGTDEVTTIRLLLRCAEDGGYFVWSGFLVLVFSWFSPSWFSPIRFKGLAVKHGQTESNPRSEI